MESGEEVRRDGGILENQVSVALVGKAVGGQGERDGAGYQKPQWRGKRIQSSASSHRVALWLRAKRSE